MDTTETAYIIQRDRAQPVGTGTPATGTADAASLLRPFRLNVPEEALVDLRRRLAQARLPEKETVSDYSQGVPLKTVQQLLHYWQTDYDWRKVEARLNAVPNFITEIDGLDIHFIHVRSTHENALPLIVTHGWPGSIIEQLKIIDPLTNPTAHGAGGADAFDLVIPSMPGYGFSGKPATTGWDPTHIARAWVVLMKRLGYSKFVAQGGDWGAIITDVMATQGHPELLGIHSNMPGVIPPDIDKAALQGVPPPSPSSLMAAGDEKGAVAALQRIQDRHYSDQDFGWTRRDGTWHEVEGEVWHGRPLSSARPEARSAC